MSSESLFTNCKACGKAVSTQAWSCPACGHRTRKLTNSLWAGIAAAGLVIVGLVAAPPVPDRGQTLDALASKSNRTSPQEMPEDESRFVQQIAEIAAAARASRNELQQSLLRDQRRDQLAAMFGQSMQVDDWAGKINALGTNSEGKAVLSVRLSDEAEVTTWNNAVSDFSDDTLVPKGSPVYQSLLDCGVGDRVRFSGSFFPSTDDHLKETSLTIEGSLTRPEFLFRFSEVVPTN